MVAVPVAMAVIVPLLTVAMAVLLLNQTTFLFVAFSGSTVAVSVSVSPMPSVVVVWFRVTPVGDCTTVRSQLAIFPLSTEIALMVDVPGAMAVMVPSLTVATAVLLLNQITFLFVAFSGITVDVSVSVSPVFSVAVVWFSVTPVTGTEVTTVTAQVSVLLPSCVVTVMVAVPTAMAVTVPLFTVAMAVLLLDQVTFLFVAFSGSTVGVSVSVSPMPIVVVVRFSVMPVTGTFAAFTVRMQLAIFPPSTEIALMVVVPTDMAMMVPLLTVATAVLVLTQLSVGFDASAGSTVGTSVKVSPTISVADC